MRPLPRAHPSSSGWRILGPSSSVGPVAAGPLTPRARPWAAALGKLPADHASTIPRSGATTARPSAAGRSSPPSTANRGRHAPPTLREPNIHRRREPTTGDTPASIAVTRRRRIGEAVHNGQVNMGRTQQAGAEWIGRHSSTQAASPLRSTGRPFPSSGPRFAVPRTRRTLEAYPSRSRAMASILTRRAHPSEASCQRNPLGFVTLSPTGRPSNRYSQRFSPSPFGRIPRETKSPASAVLRSAPAHASAGAAPAFGRAFFASPRGTR